MFNIGDFIVYKRDVCKVIDIKEIKGYKYYTLESLSDSSLRISLPVDTDAIRSIINPVDAVSIIENVNNIELCNATNDKALEQIYKKLLISDNCMDLVKVIKTTYLRNKKRSNSGKKIGSMDSFYYEQACKKLFQELTISLNLSEDKVADYLISSINK